MLGRKAAVPFHSFQERITAIHKKLSQRWQGKWLFAAYRL